MNPSRICFFAIFSKDFRKLRSSDVLAILLIAYGHILPKLFEFFKLNIEIAQNIFDCFWDIAEKMCIRDRLRVHRLDRDIDRSQMETDDTLDILVLHICQGDVVSLEERKSRVIVLKEESFTHSRRHLVDKAEDALVGT